MSPTLEDQVAREPANTEERPDSRRDLFMRGTVMLSGVAFFALPAACARAQEPPAASKPADKPSGPSLYDRLGGIFAIAAVVNYFSDEIIKDPIAGAQSANPRLREWHTKQLGRLPGLKFMRTLWVAAVSGGPFQYTPTRPGSTNLGLEEAHKDLKISPKEFDAVAAVLSRSLDHFSVPQREKSEVLAAFAAHKDEVTKGSQAAP
ncbi:hemoglobin [Caulobacter ginsengisoli]|uniref:Hemoglobin n=1 Tax=Caulobacter ginsengisoli TaxID=400775 RepID=A0ABU0INQ6_9CAUL|nr:group 1 truncated hemoglobin [Caulobacter ginsengisoli]MDQ0463627.1 hemoglobin [Caulobacter ginsengisoli]